MKDLNRNKMGGIRPKSGVGPKSLQPSATKQTLKNVGLIAMILIGAAAIGAGGGMAARSAKNFLSHSPMFAIKNIEVSGTEKLERAQILDLAGLREGQNIFNVSVEDAVLRIARSPWIKGVTVKRQYPDKVIIRVVERRVESLVIKDGLWFADGDGKLFKPVEPGDFVDLPIISSSGSEDLTADAEIMRRAVDLIGFAKESSMLPYSQISEIKLSVGGYLTILTSGALRIVEFGSGDLGEQWAVLENVLADARNSGMEASSVNLNYPSGAAVKLITTGAQTLLASGGASNAGQQ